MNTQKWIESLLDEMLESQWTSDLIKREFRNVDKLNSQKELESIEDLEPINQYSKAEIEAQEMQDSDFKKQLENFTKSDYQDYLISQAIIDIRDDEYFDEIEFSDDYLENLIRQHLDEEKDFLDMVVKEAIASDDYFQDYVENHFKNHYDDFQMEDIVFDDYEDDFSYLEYPDEKDIFDDLGDTSYMDQGIFKGENTDAFEEPFTYTYYENLFEEAAYDVEEDYCVDASPNSVDGESIPEDLIVEEPIEDDFEGLIKERLFEEKILDKTFVEIIQRDKYWDNLINEKLASDEKFNNKLNG